MKKMDTMSVEEQLQELYEIDAWLDCARFDPRLTEEEQDACWIVLEAVIRLQEELEEKKE